MITITINKKEKLAQVEAFMTEEVKTNPHLNGADYEVEIGDWVSVDGLDNEYDGATLQRSITDIIDN